MTRLPVPSQTIARCVASTIVGVLLVAAGCTDGQGRLGGTDTVGTSGDTAVGGTDTDRGGEDGGPSPSDTATEPDISVPPTEDPSTNPADNPQCVDEDEDGYFAQCPQGKDCHDGKTGINPDAGETCGDKVDNDCSGGRDNGCSCDASEASRPCYPGPAGTAGQGGCRTGEQTCTNGTWSDCQDFTLPAAEICDGDDDDCDGKVDEKVSNACGRCGKVTAEEKCSNGLDDNCDGRVDEKCQCGPKDKCYTGPPQTLGTGACRAGSRECIGEGWGPCEGSVTPTSESCGDSVDNDCDGDVDEGCNCDKAAEVCDGIDNDCDDKVDEGCTPCLSQGGKKPWQIHKGKGPQCWPKKFDKNGARAEYDFASIPAKDDAGWKPEPDNFISFDERSTMCGETNDDPNKCECRKGGDFTYFQTFFDIPPTLNVNSLKVTIENVDDGARITIFNNDHPNGVVDEGSYAFINDGGSSTTDLAQYLTTGTNRIVITHVDDCCRTRRIEGVHVTLNGEEIKKCGS